MKIKKYFPFVPFAIIALAIVIGATIKILIIDYYSILESSNPVIYSFLNKVSDYRIDIFLSQLSMSFLVTSLLSVLGNKGEPIYWQDIIEYKLVKPENLGFKHYTIYCFILVLLSLIFTVFDWPEILCISYVFNMIFLMLMTLKMVGIYYDKESIKKEIRNEYNNSSFEEKSRKIENLFQFTAVALQEKNYNIVKENVKFLLEENNTEKVFDILQLISYDQTVLFVEIAKIVRKQCKDKELFIKLNDTLTQYMRWVIKKDGQIDVLVDFMFEPIRIKISNNIDELKNSINKDELKNWMFSTDLGGEQKTLRQITILTYRWGPIELANYAYKCGSFECMSSILYKYWECINNFCHIFNDDSSLNNNRLEHYGLPLTVDEKEKLTKILERDEEEKQLSNAQLRSVHLVLENDNWYTQPITEFGEHIFVDIYEEKKS